MTVQERMAKWLIRLLPRLRVVCVRSPHVWFFHFFPPLPAESIVLSYPTLLLFLTLSFLFIQNDPVLPELRDSPNSPIRGLNSPNTRLFFGWLFGPNASSMIPPVQLWISSKTFPLIMFSIGWPTTKWIMTLSVVWAKEDLPLNPAKGGQLPLPQLPYLKQGTDQKKATGRKNAEKKKWTWPESNPRAHLWGFPF
jgi:hypothetical protein